MKHQCPAVQIIAIMSWAHLFILLWVDLSNDAPINPQWYDIIVAAVLAGIMLSLVHIPDSKRGSSNDYR